MKTAAPTFRSMLQWTGLAVRVARYNLKIIFGNKFIFFFLAAVGFFLLLNVIFALSGSSPSYGIVYYYLLFPGLLLVFYPSTFGLQNDTDARMLEILFGIPDYRYKVWLIRLVMMDILALLVLLGLAALSKLTVMPVPVFSMTVQLMLPILFWASLGFAISTIVRSGNGAAAVMIIIGLFLFILMEPLRTSKWNIFLNPYNIPSDMNETIWESIVRQNRLYLLAGTILSTLFGLFQLQKRERYVKG
jgi:hypothetical protein